MPDTVVISGGAGFIGTALTRRLLETTDARVVLLDSLHPQVHANPVWPEPESDRVRHVLGDAAEQVSWDRAFAGAQGLLDVVHLAAETGTGQSLTEARRHATVNVVGTAALTDALSARGLRPRGILLTSSRAVYGEGRWTAADGSAHYADTRSPARLDRGEWAPSAGRIALTSPLPHDAAVVEPRPTNVYAATKLAQEHLLAAWCQAMGVDLTVLRLQNVYGAGQALQNSYTGVLTYFANRLIADEAIQVYEGGGILRDFVHVEDVVGALVAALQRPDEGVRRLDIGSGAPRTLLEVARVMSEVASGPEPVVTEQYRPGDVRAAFADIGAARQVLGYAPRVALADGLAGLLDYARAELVRA